MFEIRELNETELRDAIRIKVKCWTEELAGKGKNTLSEDEEYESALEWKKSEKENNDIRLLIGVFEDGTLLGTAFASFAEETDIESNGIELNGFWVDENHRGRGLSLLLLDYVLSYFEKLGMTKMVVYNHRYAPSNSYYRKFGAKAIRQDYQMGGKLLIDVFLCDIAKTRKQIHDSSREASSRHEPTNE